MNKKQRNSFGVLILVNSNTHSIIFYQYKFFDICWYTHRIFMFNDDGNNNNNNNNNNMILPDRSVILKYGKINGKLFLNYLTCTECVMFRKLQRLFFVTILLCDILITTMLSVVISAVTYAKRT